MEKIKGFTFIELLVCLSMMAILGLLSLSSFKHFQERNQFEIRKNTLKEAILYAKQQSFILQKKLVLAGLNEGDWSTGLILFIDSPQHRYNEKKQLIKQWNWSSSLVTIRWRGFHSGDYLVFSPELRQSALNGRFELIGKDGGQMKLILNRLGRIRQ